MHPADVAAYVSASVEELREQVAARSDLDVTAIELSGLELAVTFRTSTSETAHQGFGVGGNVPGEFATIAGGLEVPIIGTLRTETFKLRFELTDWDTQPPAVLLCDERGVLLPNHRWPHTHGSRGIVEGHPIFGPRMFFCRPGTREFHSHPQHEETPWDAIREGTELHHIVIDLLFNLTYRWTFRS